MDPIFIWINANHSAVAGIICITPIALWLRAILKSLSTFATAIAGAGTFEMLASSITIFLTSVLVAEVASLLMKTMLPPLKEMQKWL